MALRCDSVSDSVAKICGVTLTIAVDVWSAHNFYPCFDTDFLCVKYSLYRKNVPLASSGLIALCELKLRFPRADSVSSLVSFSLSVGFSGLPYQRNLRFFHRTNILIITWREVFQNDRNDLGGRGVVETGFAYYDMRPYFGLL